eukprot:CAMPEP_0174697366 /NCGR_PEP_ID=MMETSP1094-20130205/3248_1 /TAXON_ID=156173 /ORGANISM="Chrysochromulina brevifilum, Strain UTEX LB 985" /LENGTH=209 /DNA_ID=CAMNT_0015894323 /DNA_START=284 /DNA_END=916 /DNA_ORIENTATION=+
MERDATSNCVGAFRGTSLFTSTPTLPLDSSHHPTFSPPAQLSSTDAGLDTDDVPLSPSLSTSSSPSSSSVSNLFSEMMGAMKPNAAGVSILLTVHESLVRRAACPRASPPHTLAPAEAPARQIATPPPAGCAQLHAASPSAANKPPGLTNHRGEQMAGQPRSPTSPAALAFTLHFDAQVEAGFGPGVEITHIDELRGFVPGSLLWRDVG